MCVHTLEDVLAYKKNTGGVYSRVCTCVYKEDTCLCILWSMYMCVQGRYMLVYTQEYVHVGVQGRYMCVYTLNPYCVSLLVIIINSLI